MNESKSDRATENSDIKKQRRNFVSGRRVTLGARSEKKSLSD